MIVLGADLGGRMVFIHGVGVGNKNEVSTVTVGGHDYSDHHPIKMAVQEKFGNIPVYGRSFLIQVKSDDEFVGITK